MAVPLILGVALRICPQLPPTIAERIKDYRARNVADWVMYRKALAAAAEARGWPVHWYDAKKVVAAAGQALRVDNFDAHFLHMRKALGSPWNNDHKLAMAAAIVAAQGACGVNADYESHYQHLGRRYLTVLLPRLGLGRRGGTGTRS